MRPSFRRVLSGFVGTLVFSTNSDADGIPFGAFDVPTVFFISKSDDRNRVDYGMRLDQRCDPVTAEPVFPYWREFERSPPVRTHSLGMFEWMAYGIAEQRVVRRTAIGSTTVVTLKQVRRPISITTHKDVSGRCAALGTMTIAGSEGAELVSVYVKLAGFLSVEYVKVVGKDPKTGLPVEERLHGR